MNFEVRADGHNTLRRGADNFFNLGGCVPGLALRDAYPRLLARQGERHKNGLALQTGQECSAVDWLLDFDEKRLGEFFCGRRRGKRHCWLI